MDKNEFIVRLSCVLNRGASADAAKFANMKHAELLAGVSAFLEAHRECLGPIRLESSQMLNDRGVDLLLCVEDCKIRFQIKSHFDVTEDDFAAKVKRQFTESFSHSLDKYYIMICSPLNDNGKDYSGKINHLINELSLLATPYHCIYGPLNMATLFSGIVPLTKEECQTMVQRFIYRRTTQDDIRELRNLIESSMRSRRSTPTLSVMQAIDGRPPLSLKTIAAELKWEHDEDELSGEVTVFRNLYQKLKSMTHQSREFLSFLVKYSRQKNGYTISRASSYRCIDTLEIEQRLHLHPQDILRQIKLIDKTLSAGVDTDDPNNPVIVFSADTEWDIFGAIKDYCQKRQLNVDTILVDIDFGLLD